MSAFIVTRRTMDVVVTALQDGQHGAGQRVFAGQVITNDSKTLDAVGRHLWDLNARAVAGRYPSGADQMVGEGHELAKTYRWTGTYWPTATRQQLRCRYAKAISCLRYQCAEDATIGDPIYAELTAALHALCLEIVGDLRDYEAAPWDFEEKDVPKVVRLI